MSFDRILNLVLAVALAGCVFQVMRSSGNAPKSEPVAAVQRSASPLTAVFERKSIRQYTDRKLDRTQIETLLKAAMCAPTARNKQPWCFVVVEDKALLKKLSAGSPNWAMLEQAAVGIVVCADSSRMLEGPGEPMWIQDCSAANENLLIAAQGLGLGAVWLGVHPIAERIQGVREALNLPLTWQPLAIDAVGYPAENPPVKNKWKPENILWK